MQNHKNYNSAWNLSKESLEYLKEVIKKNKLNNILEIGTYNALTAIEFARISGKVTTIEKDSEFIKIAKENIKISGLRNADLIEGDAKEVLKDFVEKKKLFDLILIDAMKREYKEYLLLSLKLVKKGFIYADNTISHKDKLKDFFYCLIEMKLDWKELNIGKGLVEIEIK